MYNIYNNVIIKNFLDQEEFCNLWKQDLLLQIGDDILLFSQMFNEIRDGTVDVL